MDPRKRFRTSSAAVVKREVIVIMVASKTSVSSGGSEIYYCLETIAGRVNKLDQEMWLCRTHLDGFIVKIWTILDHTRTRLNLVIKAILLNLWLKFLDI